MDGHLHIHNLTGHGRGPYTFDVPPGKCTVLSGASGSGKSLLLRMIADLDPNDGDVRLGNLSREALSGPAWRREVIYVAAESGWWADDVRAHFGEEDAIDPRLDQLARHLCLRADILAAPVSHLSTGERQRLALLRAVMRRPRFLLLDEPTSALDRDTTLAVEAVLKRVMTEGIGLLVVSHNEEQAARLRNAQFRLCQNGLEAVSPMSPILLTTGDLVLASLLIVAGAALSLVMSLHIHRTLLWAAVRMVVQLMLVGLILRAVFELSSPWVTLLVVLAMILAAAREAGSRQERRFDARWQFIIGLATVSVPTLVITVLALVTALRPSPWYDARHAIPLAGIILGNAMNAASLTLQATFTAAWHQRQAIDARLALGDDRHTALRPILRQAVRSGLLPTVNTMAAAGIITLPGIMTGQILAGMDPIDAARYQILLMFLLAGGSLLAVVLAAWLAAWRLTDARHRLRLDRLQVR